MRQHLCLDQEDGDIPVDVRPYKDLPRAVEELSRTERKIWVGVGALSLFSFPDKKKNITRLFNCSNIYLMFVHLSLKVIKSRNREKVNHIIATTLLWTYCRMQGESVNLFFDIMWSHLSEFWSTTRCTSLILLDIPFIKTEVTGFRRKVVYPYCSQGAHV